MTTPTDNSSTPPTGQDLPRHGTPPSPGGGGSVDAAPPAEQGNASEIVKQVEEQKIERFQDQCFLIDGWKTLESKNSGKSYKSIIPIQLHASEIVSIMAAEPDAGVFLKLTPAQLSLLVPQIRVFLVDYNVAGSRHTEGGLREIYFEDHLREDDVSKIFSGQAGRGAGAGIESFNYSFDGGNPVTATKDISANLSMVFTDMAVFTRVQPNGASYVDLCERIPKKVSDPPELKPNPCLLYTSPSPRD